MPVQIDDPLAKEALVNILLIETSQKFSAAPEKVRRSQVIEELGGERSKAEGALETLKRLKCVRFVLFGCVELTTSGRLTALQLYRA
jgi:Mn-dependent DtxR family transcriptional regulator